jgi:acetylornithine deacetylase
MAAVTTLLSDKELLRRLVAIDSVSGQPTAPIIELLCEDLDRPGINLTRVQGTATERENLVAWIGPPLAQGARRQGLVLSGHMDVVPPGDPALWDNDPFRLTESSKGLVGRGACDMKASIALFANLAAAHAASPPPHPLVLVLTCDEELGTLGARAFVEHWPSQQPLPSSAIIGEPTSLRAVRMHKGHLSCRVVVHGRSAHSGSPHLGDNAIVRAQAILQKVQALADQITAEPAPNAQHFPTVPSPVLTVATIQGGSAINVVPDRCEIGIGLRMMPGMDPAAGFQRLAACVDDEHVEIELVNDSPPMLADADAPVHSALCRMLDQRDTVGVSFGSDGGHLSSLGIDCVLFGPGAIEVAHMPNEFVPEQEMAVARDTLAGLINEFCFA